MSNTLADELLVDLLNNFIYGKYTHDEFSGSVMVSKSSHAIFQTTAGFSNFEKRTLNNINTKFNLGSCNKMFTGIAIAQLAQNNLLSFNDVVGKFLPDYPNQTVKEKITIHHLLTHSSGLGSFIDLRYRPQFLQARPYLTTTQSVVDLFKNRDLEYPVGEVHYSSDGFELLGLIIEKVAGQSYSDFVTKNIFLNFNMFDTYNYQNNLPLLPENLALGYTRRNPETDQLEYSQRHLNTDLNLVKGTSGGGGYSTCRDLINFAQALMFNKLLSLEMTEKVLTPYVVESSKNGLTKAYGYGFQIWDIRGTRRVGHPGMFAGVSARFDIFPKMDYTFVALCNYDPPIASEVGDKFTEFVA